MDLLNSLFLLARTNAASIALLTANPKLLTRGTSRFWCMILPTGVVSPSPGGFPPTRSCVSFPLKGGRSFSLYPTTGTSQDRVKAVLEPFLSLPHAFELGRFLGLFANVVTTPGRVLSVQNRDLRQ